VFLGGGGGGGGVLRTDGSCGSREGRGD